MPFSPSGPSGSTRVPSQSGRAKGDTVVVVAGSVEVVVSAGVVVVGAVVAVVGVVAVVSVGVDVSDEVSADAQPLRTAAQTRTTEAAFSFTPMSVAPERRYQA